MESNQILTGDYLIEILLEMDSLLIKEDINAITKRVYEMLNFVKNNKEELNSVKSEEKEIKE